MLPLTGYADRLSVRPGETIRFHLANATGAEVEAKLVRVVCADANPAGPGVVVEPVASPPTAVAAAGEERVPRGSYARIEDVGRCFGAGGFSITCLVHPTRLAGARQAIVSRTGASHAGASGTAGSRVGASHSGASETDGSRVGASHRSGGRHFACRGRRFGGRRPACRPPAHRRTVRCRRAPVWIHPVHRRAGSAVRIDRRRGGDA